MNRRFRIGPSRLGWIELWTTSPRAMSSQLFPFVVCFPEIYIQMLVEAELKAGPGFLSYLSNILCQRSPFGCGHVARDTSDCTVVVVVAGVLTTCVPLVLALAFPKFDA